MTPKKIEFTVSENDNNSRLDKVLSAQVDGSSRSFLQELIKAGSVSVNGKTITLPRFAVKAGMCIEVTIPEPEAEDTLAVESDFDFDIIYEDESMLVINKPAGVAVHPGAGNPDGTIVNALLGRYPGFAGVFPDSDVRPGIVHRLDKDTSGCLVIAKTPQAMYKLSEAFAMRETKKKYLALVRGIPAQNTMEINNFIGRHPVNRQKMAVVDRGGKNAVSRYRVLNSGVIGKEKISLVEVAIFTGRTHQIRVHMAHIGHPVLGDEVYGGSRTVIENVGRQMLHAYSIEIPHPLSGKNMVFKAELPDDFQNISSLITGAAL
ncbi:MAG: RluA family pseudouridine synthase [Lentisphaeria bacterium]|nr:RluA family pseudouridine synthase [Lentisphaeria bacterium]